MSERAQNQSKQSSPASFTPVSSGVLQRKCACGNHTMAGNECAECGKKKQTLQRASLSPRGREMEGERGVPPIVHEVLRSPGQPLDPATRSFMEPRFEHDFSQVQVHTDPPPVVQTSLTIGPAADRYEQEAERVAEGVMRTPDDSIPSGFRSRTGYDFARVLVHTDAKAAESAQAVNALAYTVGQDVVFGAGQYSPETREGRKLIAHELTHTIQQKATGTGRSLTIMRQLSKGSIPQAGPLGRFPQMPAGPRANCSVATSVESTIEKPRNEFEQEIGRAVSQINQRPVALSALQNNLPILQRQVAHESKSQKALKASDVNLDKYVEYGKKGELELLRLINALWHQSKLKNYVRTNIEITGDKLLLEDESEFITAYTKTYNEKPGEDVPGFTDPQSHTIHLKVTVLGPKSSRARIGSALHESVHSFQHERFSDAFGQFLNEGITQYFADVLLEDLETEKGKKPLKYTGHEYKQQLACAEKLIRISGQNSVAEAYFKDNGTLSLKRKMLKEGNFKGEDFNKLTGTKVEVDEASKICSHWVIK